MPGGNPFDQDLNTTDSPSFVDGSFSGNLNTEVGGTQRVYGQGTEGDTDTHYLQTEWDGSFYRIGAKSTGATGNKSIMLDYAGASRLFISSSEVRIYKYLRPSDTTIDIGSSTNPFRTVYSVNGSFSGQLDVESGGSQKYYNLGQEGDTDTEYLEQTWTGNVCKYRALATGAGSVRRIDFEGSGIRFTAAGVAIAEIASGDLRLYSGRTIRPLLDNDASVGKAGQRFTNVYSYGGDFSGDVIMAANVDFTGLPTADPSSRR